MKEDVAHEYEVTVSVECEAYATPPIKPWNPQAKDNGVILVEFMVF